MSEIIQPQGWKRPRGYSHAVLAQGRILAIAGQIGWNEGAQLVSDDFLEQAEQALRNLVTIVESAGGTAASIVRLTWYVTDKREYVTAAPELGRVYQAVLGKHYPAMTLVQVAALLEDRAKVEIEATAVL